MEKVCVSSSDPILGKLLTEEEIRLINNPSCQDTKKYIETHLSSDKRSIINTGERDEIILAIIACMISEEPERLKKFDKYWPKTGGYYSEFLLTQKQWTLTEKGLLRTEDDLKVINYARIHRNAERFRAFYVIKHPDKVEYIGD